MGGTVVRVVREGMMNDILEKRNLKVKRHTVDRDTPMMRATLTGGKRGDEIVESVTRKEIGNGTFD